MKRAALLLLALAGCGGKPAVLVTLTSEARIGDITLVRLSVDHNNQNSVADYPTSGAAIGPSEPQTLVAVLPADRTGELFLVAGAFNGKNLLAFGGAVGSAEKSRETHVTIPITPGYTGHSCSYDTECRPYEGAQAKPICQVRLYNVDWPRGYCRAACSTSKNHPTQGTNPDCPGGGTCDSEGRCLQPCQAGGCTREGYACFTEGCMPLALSQCNPTRRGVCGGGRTCFRLGVDDVGGCYTSCNPFQQSCARIDGKGAGCYVSFDTGEAGCLIYNVNAEGAPCRFLNDCNPGLMCWSGACRPYCGGPQARACANGKKCIAFSSAVPITTAGVCGG